jgi:HEAT repeat protein
MIRKYLNYLLFMGVVAIVTGMAVQHSRTVHRLVSDMGSTSPAVKSAAALELIRTEQFSDSITGEPLATRLHAAEALEALGLDTSVVPDKSQKDAPDYRASAVSQAIGLLKDTDSRVRDRAVQTLQKIGYATPTNLKKLVLGVGDGDNSVRRGVRQTFTDLKNGIGPKPGVVEALVDRMKADAPTRGPAGDILGSKLFTSGGNDVSVKLLVDILTVKDAKGYKSDEGNRSGAADALGKIGDVRAVEPLLKAMAEDSPGIRRVSIGALALIALPECEAALEEALANANDDKQARSQAASGLGKIATEHAIAALASALDDRDMDIRAAASAALARAAHPDLAAPLNARVVDSLTKALTAGSAAVQRGAATALQTALQGASAADAAAAKADSALTAILTSKTSSPDMRAAAASALGYAGNRSAVPALIDALEDSNASVCIAARDALSRVGADAADPLSAKLGKGDVGALYASQALAQIGEPALPALEKTAANGTNPTAQRWSAVALGGIGISRSTELLQTLARNSDRQVASAAKEQLIRLGQISE